MTEQRLIEYKEHLEREAQIHHEAYLKTMGALALIDQLLGEVKLPSSENKEKE